MLKYFCSLACAVALTAATSVRACDLCGCFTPQLETTASITGQPHGWLDGAYFAVAEQFTYFGSLQLDGHDVRNPTDQHLNSSITQLVAGYAITSRFSLQINVPLISRSYSRPEGFAIEHGTEAGLGDASLLGRFVVYRKESGGRRGVNFDDPKNPRMEMHEPDFTFSALVIGGVKFPTGDARRIKEEFNEMEIEGAPVSGIHGHDLTLGTGSYDGIFGVQFATRYRSFFFEADTQFTLRGDGAHQYHFANDLTWNGGPGYYFMRKGNSIFGLQFVCSGEHKDVDHF